MNSETMKQVYLLAQEHCGLKVGDWVRVTRKAENYEAGWDNCWVNNDILFETPYTVVSLSKKRGVILNCGMHGERAFPYFILEKVEKPAHKFKPFDKVLVRDSENNKWRCDFYSYRDNAGIYHCTGKGNWWQYCIPYEGNEHLVGTTDDSE